MEEAKHDGDDQHHDHHRKDSKHIHWHNSIPADSTEHKADHPEMTEKEKKALKKKKKKKLKSIGKRHPEFELTYDMMLGIRYAVSLSERSVSAQSQALILIRHTTTHQLVQEPIPITPM